MIEMHFLTFHSSRMQSVGASYIPLHLLLQSIHSFLGFIFVNDFALFEVQPLMLCFLVLAYHSLVRGNNISFRLLHAPRHKRQLPKFQYNFFSQRPLVKLFEPVIRILLQDGFDTNSLCSSKQAGEEPCDLGWGELSIKNYGLRICVVILRQRGHIKLWLCVVVPYMWKMIVCVKLSINI